MKVIKLTEIYPVNFTNNNMELVLNRLVGKRVSFNRGSIVRLGDRARLEDFAEESKGTIVYMDNRNNRDYYVKEDKTGHEISVDVNGIFMEEYTETELDVLIQKTKRVINAAEEEREGYLSLISFMKEEKLEVLSPSLLKKKKITNFVAGAINIGADKEKIEEAVEQLLITL